MLVRLLHQIFDVDVAPLVGVHYNNLHARHDRTGGVGTVSRDRDKADVAVVIAIGLVVSTNAKETSVLTLGNTTKHNQGRGNNQEKLTLQKETCATSYLSPGIRLLRNASKPSDLG